MSTEYDVFFIQILVNMPRISRSVQDFGSAMNHRSRQIIICRKGTDYSVPFMLPYSSFAAASIIF